MCATFLTNHEAPAVSPLLLAALNAPRPPRLRLGVLLVMLAGSLALAAAAWSPPAPALVSPGFVQSDLERQPVEHATGGVVRAVLVRNGERVAAGQALLLLADADPDRSRQQLVTAPIAGEVRNLRVAGPGVAVGPGEPLAMILPDAPTLVIETRLRAADVARVQEGQAASIRFGGARADQGQTLPGRVLYLSPDRLVDSATRMDYYTVLVAADPKALADAGGARLLAGEPAEVVIASSPHTPLHAIAAPLAALWRAVAPAD